MLKLLPLLVLFTVGNVFSQKLKLTRNVMIDGFFNSLNPREITIYKNNLYFFSDKITNFATTFYKVEGSSVTLLHDSGIQYSVKGLKEYGHKLYFTSSGSSSSYSGNLFVTEGNSVNQISGGDITRYFGIHNSLYFRASVSGPYGSYSDVFVTDGKINRKLDSLDQINEKSDPHHHLTIGKTSFYNAIDKFGKNYLWVSDDTARPKRIDDILVTSNIVEFKGSPYFGGVKNGITSFYRSESMEGSAHSLIPTSLAKDINNLNVIGDSIFFTMTHYNRGSELWLFKDNFANPVKNIAPITLSTNFQNFLSLKGKLYFTTKEFNNKISFWRSNGSETGTTSLHSYTADSVQLLGENNIIYIVASNPERKEIWIYNINTNSIDSLISFNQNVFLQPKSFQVLNDKLFFLWQDEDQDGLHVFAINALDRSLSKLLPEKASDSPSALKESELLKVPGYLYVFANYPEYGNELWYIEDSPEIITNASHELGDTDNILSLYPNPANEFFFVTQKDVKSLKVMTIAGEEVISNNSIESGINVSTLHSGLYIVEILNSQGEKFYGKLIKQ